MTADVESEAALFQPLKLELLSPLVAAQLEGWVLLRMSDYALSSTQEETALSLSVQLAAAMTEDILDGTVRQKDAIAVWFEDHQLFPNTVTVNFRLSWPYGVSRRRLAVRALNEGALPEDVPPIPTGSRSPILGDILVSSLLEPPSEGALPFVEGFKATLAGVSTTVLLKQEPLNLCEGDPGALERGFCVRDGEIIRLNRGNGTESDVPLPELDAEVAEAERKTDPDSPETKTPVHVDDNIASYLIAGLGTLVVLLLAFAARRHFQYVETMEEIHARDNPEPPKDKPDENPTPAGSGPANQGDGSSEPQVERAQVPPAATGEVNAGDSPARPTADARRSRTLQPQMIDDSAGFTALEISPQLGPHQARGNRRRGSGSDVGGRPRALSSEALPPIAMPGVQAATRATSTDMSVVSLHSSVSAGRRGKLKPVAPPRGGRGDNFRIRATQQAIDFDDTGGAIFIGDTSSLSDSTPTSYRAQAARGGVALQRPRLAVHGDPPSPTTHIQAPFAAGEASHRHRTAVRFAPANLAPPFGGSSSHDTDSPAAPSPVRGPSPIRSRSVATDQDAVRLASSEDSTAPSLGSRPFPSSEVYGGAGAGAASSSRSRSREKRKHMHTASSKAAKVSLRYLVRRQAEGKTDADGSTQSGGTTEPDVWSVGDNVSVAMLSRRVSNGTHDISSGR